MTKRLIPLALYVALISCGPVFESDEEAYRRHMHCADRATTEESVDKLQRGFAFCDPLPLHISTPSEARRHYLEKAWELKKDSPDPPIAIALSYWEEGAYSNALEFFDAARARSPGDPSPIVGMITMHRLLGDEELALTWTKRIEEEGTDDGRKIARYLEARVHYDAGRYEEAREGFEEALDIAEKRGFFLGGGMFTMKNTEFFLAQIALEEGDAVEADAHFRAYIEKNSEPELVSYMNWLADQGPQDQASYYDQIEAGWIRTRQ